MVGRNDEKWASDFGAKRQFGIGEEYNTRNKGLSPHLESPICVNLL
jgi:hypothetical protein